MYVIILVGPKLVHLHKMPDYSRIKREFRQPKAMQGPLL